MVVMTGSTDVTSFLMSETRQQNTEVRLSIGKVADKVDQLSSKVCAAFRVEEPPWGRRASLIVFGMFVADR